MEVPMPQVDSLAACLASIKKDFVGPDVAVPARSLWGGMPIASQPAPCFMFRGENAPYSSMESSMERLRANEHLSTDIATVESVAQSIGRHLENHVGLSPPGAASLLQHYGLPTELIDVSSSAAVAAFFAVFGNTCGIGTISVFDTRAVADHACLIGMGELDFAWRPVRQAGYGISDQNNRNLRAAGFLSKVNVEEYSFPLTAAATTYLRRAHELLLDYQDPSRAIIVHLIDCLVKNDGPFTYGVAKWLADHVPPTPLTVTNLHGSGRTLTYQLGARPGSPKPYNPNYDQCLNVSRWAQQISRNILRI
jgi:hypothetical protein